MKKISGLKIDLVNLQTLKLPKGSKILRVESQNDIPHIWFMFNLSLEKDLEDRCFELYPTGINIEPANRKYIGTFQIRFGVYVYHLFEKYHDLK